MLELKQSGGKKLPAAEKNLAELENVRRTDKREAELPKKEDEMLKIAKWFLKRNTEKLVRCTLTISGFALTILLILVVVSGISFPPEPAGVVLLGVLLSIITGPVIYTIGWLSLRPLAKYYIHAKFKELFGVDAPDKDTLAHVLTVICARVENSLANHAVELNDACLKQAVIAKDPVNAYDIVATNNHIAGYNTATENLLAAKQSFWRRHEVAALNGIPVEESFKSYLPACVTAHA